MKKLKLHELGRPSIEEYIQQNKRGIRIILDNVRSALNVGSAFRTADGFGIEGLDLCGISAQPPHKEIRKTAIGATDSVDWTYHADTKTHVIALKEKGYKVYAIEQADESLELQDWTIDDPQNAKIAIIFGNEVNGVDQEVIDICDHCIEVPQFGTKHSFNIAVTIGIILWHYQLQYFEG